jgi:hypothetical protein
VGGKGGFDDRARFVRLKAMSRSMRYDYVCHPSLNSKGDGATMTSEADKRKPIVFTAHARQRMKERGADEEAVREAIRIGEQEPGKEGRVLYRLNREFKQHWDGRYFGMQQIVPVVVDEKDRLAVITVYTFYFQEGEKR